MNDELKKSARYILYLALFFKVQEIIKFSEAESKMISSFQPLNMLNLLIIN
jgi:hypothetical protein